MIGKLIITMIALILFWPLGVVLGLYFLFREMRKASKYE